MNKLTFLDLEGVNFLKDSILSIITDNEEVTASALIDLKTRLDEATSILNTLPVKYGNGDHSIVTRNTDGTQNEANGWGSISLFGYGNKAYGSNSFAGGDSNNASGTGSVVIGGKDNVTWNEATNSAIIGGHNNTVQSANSFISGGNNTISNQYDVIFGYNNYVSGIYSGAFGYGNNVYNTASFALGSMNTINSQWGFAEGGNNTVNGEFSHAEGYNNNVNYSINSHVEGDSNYIDNSSTSHAEGANNYLYGVCSHVEGEYNSINGNYAHAEGYKTQVYNNYEHAQGKYNISNSGTIHSIGIGSDDYDRKNAFEVTSDGKIYVYGIGGYDGTSLTDKGDLASTVMVRVIKITYSDLYNLVQSNGLIPGAKYRITDYETIVGSSTYWKSAGHPFDIILTALSENKLDENCTCTLRDGDTYFADSHIESWNIKYTIYNNVSDFNWANTGTGKGVIYWMEDQNHNFAPFDFKNIKINPNGGSGTSATDTYNTAKNMASDLIQNDISSEFLRSADGFYYMFSSFDGETDLSLKNHYVQHSGVGILGKSDAVQYLSGCVILAPTEVELHNVVIKYGYWSAIIFTGLNTTSNTYGKINISDVRIGYISKSLLMIGNGAIVNIDYLSSSYIYWGYAKCININMLVRGFICVTGDATYFTIAKQINDLIINVCYLSSTSLSSGQYIKYIGSNSFSDLKTGNSLSRVIMDQTFARGTSTAYEDLKSIFDGVNLKEKMAYTTRVYYKSGGILAGTYEFNAYNKYELPTASSSVLGGIKVGSNLSIDANGVLSTHDPYTHPDTHAASMITGLATVATSGSYNDLTNKPTIPDLTGVEGQIEILGRNLDTLSGSVTASVGELSGLISTNAGNIATNAGNISTNAGKIGTLEEWKTSLNTTSGSATKPIYWKDGVPTKCTHTLEQSVTTSSKLTDTYPSTFTWTPGTTDGPTGSLTGTGMTGVTFGAIPAAAGKAMYAPEIDDENPWMEPEISSGIVTTEKQSFTGQKFFNDGIWIGTGEYAEEVNTDAVRIHFGDTEGVWIGEKTDGALTLYAGGSTLTISDSGMNAVLDGGNFYIDDERVLTESDLTPKILYNYVSTAWSSSTTITSPSVNCCNVYTFTGTGTYSYPYFYIKFNNSNYKNGDEFHFIISRTSSQTISYYLYLSLSTTITGASVKIAGLTTTYAYINKAFSSIEISVIYINKVFYAIINQYK